MKIRRTWALTALAATLALTAIPCVAADTYQTVEFAAAHLDGRKMKFNLILPRDYDSTQRKYPVLYLLHGYTGHYDNWVKQSGITDYAAGYEEIIVMPEAENSWYVNNYADKKMRWEDYIILDLIPYVDRHYRIEATRNHRAIAGLSMGGYGAMMLGLKHPDMFSAIASLSAVFASSRTALFELVKEPKLHKVLLDDFGPVDNPARTSYDPFILIRSVPADEMPQLYLAIGSSDFLLDENREFTRLLSELRITYEYREVEGRHEWAVWDSQIKNVLATQAPVIGAEK